MFDCVALKALTQIMVSLSVWLIELPLASSSNNAALPSRNLTNLRYYCERAAIYNVAVFALHKYARAFQLCGGGRFLTRNSWSGCSVQRTQWIARRYSPVPLVALF